MLISRSFFLNPEGKYFVPDQYKPLVNHVYSAKKSKTVTPASDKLFYSRPIQKQSVSSTGFLQPLSLSSSLKTAVGPTVPADFNFFKVSNEISEPFKKPVAPPKGKSKGKPGSDFPEVITSKAIFTPYSTMNRDIINPENIRSKGSKEILDNRIQPPTKIKSGLYSYPDQSDRNQHFAPKTNLQTCSVEESQLFQNQAILNGQKPKFKSGDSIVCTLPEQQRSNKKTSLHNSANPEIFIQSSLAKQSEALTGASYPLCLSNHGDNQLHKTSCFLQPEQILSTALSTGPAPASSKNLYPTVKQSALLSNTQIESFWQNELQLLKSDELIKCFDDSASPDYHPGSENFQTATHIQSNTNSDTFIHIQHQKKSNNTANLEKLMEHPKSDTIEGISFSMCQDTPIDQTAVPPEQEPSHIAQNSMMESVDDADSCLPSAIATGLLVLHCAESTSSQTLPGSADHLAIPHLAYDERRSEHLQLAKAIETSIQARRESITFETGVAPFLSSIEISVNCQERHIIEQIRMADVKVLVEKKCVI